MTEPFDNEEKSAEISSYVRKFSVRYEPPEELLRLTASLAEEAREERRAQGRRMWRVSLASALVAGLTIVVGMTGLELLLDSKDPYDVVVEEAMITYRRVLPARKNADPAKFPLKDLLASFKNRLRYEPKLSLLGAEGFVLEGGSLSEVSGTDVGHLIYRSDETRLLLMIARADDDPDWPLILRGDWVTVNENPPRTFVWHHGEFIFSLVGQLSLDQFHRLSSRIGSPNK